ncbi:MAG: dUTP diphosphatase [Acidobacteriota bacterium]
MGEGHPVLLVARVPGAGDLPLPQAATEWSAGIDLRAAVSEPVVIPPLGRAIVGTGIRVALPAGHEGQVRPRSGLALRHGITILNSPGTVDADYRGEIQVILVNLGAEPYTVSRGDRVAQLVVARVASVRVEEVAELPGSDRGDGGFGHSGYR